MSHTQLLYEQDDFWFPDITQVYKWDPGQNALDIDAPVQQMRTHPSGDILVWTTKGIYAIRRNGEITQTQQPMGDRLWLRSGPD